MASAAEEKAKARIAATWFKLLTIHIDSFSEPNRM